MGTYEQTNMASPNLKEQYIYGSSRLGVLENGNRSYELTDHLGNVRAVVSEFKEVKAAYEYYAFGMGLAKIENGYRYGFNGQERDFETGNYATEYRIYDPKVAKWLSIDPMKQFINSLYSAYANNPIKLTDPNGAWIPEVKEETKQEKQEDGTMKDVKKGFLVAKMEEGDNAETLSKFLNIDKNKAEALFKEKDKDGYVKIPDEIADPINKAIQHVIDNPSSYDGWWLDHNYNCWASSIYTSQGRFPLENDISSNDKYDEGIKFTRRLLELDYVNVSDDPSKIKFGKTIIRIAQDKKSIMLFPYNATTHGAIYLGKSKDGTEYVWTKNGWENAPKVATLKETLDEYKSKVQGGGEKVNEGGYYNYVGDK